METMLWEGLNRKKVVKVQDIEPHQNPTTVFEILLSGIGDNFFEDHYPI